MWILMCVGAVWMASIIASLFHAEVVFDTNFRDAHVYLCDCVDNGEHTDPDFHQSTCGYIRWWNDWVAKNTN